MNQKLFSRLLLGATAVLLLIPQLCSESNGPDDRITIGLPKIHSGDEPHYFITLYSLLNDGDLDLRNNYQSVHQGGIDAGVRMSGQALDHHTIWVQEGTMIPWADVYLGWGEQWNVDEQSRPVPTQKSNSHHSRGHSPEYSTHPAGYPFVLAALTFGLAGSDMLEPAAVSLSWIASIWAMSSMMALLKTFQLSNLKCAGVVMLICLGTPIWHYSRAMFCEIWLLAFAVAAFSAMLNSQNGFWIGALIGLGTLMKPPFALLGVVLLFAAILQRNWKLFLSTSIPMLVGMALMLGLNYYMFGSILRSPQSWRWGNFWVGASELMFSPSHGLLLFAPISFLAASTWPEFLERTGGHGRLLLIGFLSYFGVMASWEIWDGGYCYGPRLILPVVPLFLIPLIDFDWSFRSLSSRFGWGLAMLSILINGLGAIPYWRAWNQHPLVQWIGS
ncbi:hypothetical protein AB1L42_04575 [Thalassoglobus sp. JC818]|uniref:hypothetical protein n=1 Tax=Thalassoglobus sp. JC818 TaxID=3232136 RepID=UPI0034582B9E